MNLAPIILFTYNRPEHTQKTLTSLMNNDLASQSTLYIYCDGPKPNISAEERKKIDEVRKIIRKTQWCKEVKIVEQVKNKGLANSIIDGVTEIVNKYGKIIVLEDDLITHKDFLCFMNNSLDLYEKEKKVYGVSGHPYCIDKTLPSTYFLPLSTSWGWSTWKRSWECFESNSTKLLSKVDKEAFNFGNYPFYNMLKSQEKGLIDSWAIRFYASVFLQHGLFLFPSFSLINNIGFGEEGTHTKDQYSPIPKIKEFQLKKTTKKIPVFLDEKISNLVQTKMKKSQKEVSLLKKIVSKIKRAIKQK